MPTVETRTAPVAPASRQIARTEPAGFFSARNELRAAIVAGALLLLGYVLHTWLDLPWSESVFWLSLVIGMIFGGRAALLALREGQFDIDVLMVLGAALAAGLGHPEEGALLLFLFVLSGALEDLAMQRTGREVEGLHRLMPTDALVWRDGSWVEVDAKTLKEGDRVKIRPGERVPADASVAQGSSSMDQSAITGESMPRAVKAGDELYAGTINTDDPLEAIVLRPVAQSSLQKILDLVTTAREQREPVQRFIDRLSQPYALGVVALGAATFMVFWLLLQHSWKDAAYTAVTLVIVASPCALVIATPTANLSAIARAARGGVLFKGGHAMERLANIGAVCFDKTGTLTIGRPRLYEVHPVAWSDGRDMLALAAALEADSTHPIATAIKEAARNRSVEPLHLDSTNHTAGRGIEGRVSPSTIARLGNYAFTEPLIPVCFRNRVKDVMGRIQKRGHLAVVVAAGDPRADVNAIAESASGQVAVLIMADAVRPGAHTLVRELHALNVRPVRMLTGDNRHTAQRVAESLGLDAFDAELLPADKLRIVAEMKSDVASRHPKRPPGVAVIGDGVNDAPALALADASIAIGAIGTAAALESADIVLLADDLGAVPWAVALARKARRKIVANFAFALSVIGIMAIATWIGAAIGRPIPLWLGVLAHEGGTLLVVLNSLLLFRFPAMHGTRAEGSIDEPASTAAPKTVAA